ncbi:hypothetical protein [Weissella confusa]|uniref:hypothetical protein n=1 Tax=Weissella confusa TaxID=1583 RepID=UPI001EEE5DD3|nr:hypothetical protein [Weissella confusa]
MTDKLNFAAFMQSGTTSISNYLLQHYRDLGMTNEELLVYVQTKAGIDRGELEPSTQKIGGHVWMGCADSVWTSLGHACQRIG